MVELLIGEPESPSAMQTLTVILTVWLREADARGRQQHTRLVVIRTTCGIPLPIPQIGEILQLHKPVVRAACLPWKPGERETTHARRTQKALARLPITVPEDVMAYDYFVVKERSYEFRAARENAEYEIVLHVEWLGGPTPERQQQLLPKRRTKRRLGGTKRTADTATRKGTQKQGTQAARREATTSPLPATATFRTVPSNGLPANWPEAPAKRKAPRR